MAAVLKAIMHCFAYKTGPEALLMQRDSWCTWNLVN